MQARRLVLRVTPGLTVELVRLVAVHAQRVATFPEQRVFNVVQVVTARHLPLALALLAQLASIASQGLQDVLLAWRGRLVPLQVLLCVLFALPEPLAALLLAAVAYALLGRTAQINLVRAPCA